MNNHTDIITKRFRVYGIVQGVGFRPTVSRHAAASGIQGHVSNKGPYVEIYAQGTSSQVEHFLGMLQEKPPKRSVILKIDAENVTGSEYYTDFQIIESEKTKGQIFISPDIAICEECRREIYNPSDRRYLHPFINCTCCGPRLTILDHLPYDRKRTSMKHFPMCPTCEAEYYSPESRRYDAQPVCCHDCGPEVYLAGRKERGPDAIRVARKMLACGGIVAVKGIGGFHLCCDASDLAAVSRLRQLKTRPKKPFAVMMRDESVVKRECEITPEQEKILTGHQKPIVLLRRKNTGYVREECAPGNPFLGVMLPYAPIQMLLFDYKDDQPVSDCLVMTSGNVSGAPICRTDEDAIRELGGMCDLILSNNRPILTRADDTVMDFYENRPYMIRRSRGYAPLPVLTSRPLKGHVLALGGELKNTFALGVDELFYPSAYVGDLSDIRTVKALEESVFRMEELLEMKPEYIAADLHPGYQSSMLAEKLASTAGIPLIKVQHHYAHIVSCMAENDFFDPVIGISFDGTGYGTDGTIWGGEILIADPIHHIDRFERIGHVSPFWQIGGDIASREGWRIAVSILYNLVKQGELADIFQEKEGHGNPSGSTVRKDRNPKTSVTEIIRRLDLCEDKMIAPQLAMYDHQMNAVLSTSVGRLFDAAAAICGVCNSQTFEGEAACALEYAAMDADKQDRIDTKQYIDISSGDGSIILATDNLMALLVRERFRGRTKETLAYMFHEGLASLIDKGACEARERTGISVITLSGGVFQNTLLLAMTEQKLKASGFQVLTHQLIPPNDGGIALGQAVIASLASCLDRRER